MCIAKWLNAAGIAPPQKEGGWANTTIRKILRRSLYRGQIIFGRSIVARGARLGRRRLIRRGPKAGKRRGRAQVPQKHEELWVRTSVEHLRIVPPELAARVDARFEEIAERREASGKVQKSPGSYLLSGGMLICPTCGGNFEARKKRGVYACGTRRRKPRMCSNTLTLPIEETDTKVLEEVENELLSPKYIEELLSLLEETPDQTERLQAEIGSLQREIDRLLELTAEGVSAKTIAPKVEERETKKAKLESQLRTPRPVARNKEKLRDELKKRTEVWREILRDRKNVGVARAVIRKLIGPLELWEGPVPEVPDYLQKYVEDPHWSQVPGGIPEPGDPGPKPRKVGFSADAKPNEALDGLVPPSSPTEG